MNVLLKAEATFLEQVRADLVRPHRFAAERVGFLTVGAASANNTTLVLFAQGYHPVEDQDYIDDPSVGAMMGQEAIRKALNLALASSVGVFHIHLHDHRGVPAFSRTDLREQPKFVPDFFKVRRQMPHGAIVLSHDAASGRCWLAPDVTVPISEFVFVGPRTSIQQFGKADRLDFKV